MHKLIIEDDEGKAVVFPLIRSEISIGRQESNAIRLTEQNVSRRHARLVRREGQYVLEDLSSYMGTKVNGTLITSPTALSEGDRVLIGDYRIALTAEGATTLAGLSPVEGGASAGGPSAGGKPTAAPASAPSRPDGETVTGELEPTPATPARLVMLTPPRIGREFPLTGDTMVIGRASENDVVLAHRSIERRHAKVLRDGQRYVVVDLQTAESGVLVNGAAYRRVELKAGDVLSMGKVRLRFAAAGEAVAAEQSARPPTRSRLIFGAVATAALAAAVIVARVKEGGETALRLPSSAPERVAARPHDRRLPPVAPVEVFPPLGRQAIPVRTTTTTTTTVEPVEQAASPPFVAAAPAPSFARPDRPRAAGPARRLVTSAARRMATDRLDPRRRTGPALAAPAPSANGPAPARERPRRKPIDANDPYLKDQP